MGSTTARGDVRGGDLCDSGPIVLRLMIEAEVFAGNQPRRRDRVVWLAARGGPARGAWRVALLALVAGCGLGNLRDLRGDRAGWRTRRGARRARVESAGARRARRRGRVALGPVAVRVPVRRSEWRRVVEARSTASRRSAAPRVAARTSVARPRSLPHGEAVPVAVNLGALANDARPCMASAWPPIAAGAGRLRARYAAARHAMRSRGSHGCCSRCRG